MISSIMYNYCFSIARWRWKKEERKPATIKIITNPIDRIMILILDFVVTEPVDILKL